MLYTCCSCVATGTDYIFYAIYRIASRLEPMLISGSTPLHSSGIVDTLYSMMVMSYLFLKTKLLPLYLLAWPLRAFGLSP